MKKVISSGGVHRKALKKRGYERSEFFHSKAFGNFFPKKREKKEDFFMRKALVILFALLLVAPLVAQERTGRITGVVVDQDGNPIPGVTVTLLATAGAPMQAISSAEGTFRFLALPPSTGYALKSELEGFKTKTETGVIVAVAQTTEISLTMEMGALEEEITVVAVSPVVETKKTSISTTMNYETLQSLPSARDPWVILQMTPQVQVDRENVGGNESGQQASFVALGGDGDNDTWTMDGVNFTDPAAMGASSTYFDYDVFEEINVTIGGADVETQTGGVSLNMVSRRGENRVTFGGRFYYTESAFQSDPTGASFEEVEAVFPGYGYNQIRDIKDYGFNIGGPFLKDKIWWWGSWGTQDIKTRVINGSKDDTLLVNYAGKVNVQLIPENRLELFIHSGAKLKYGRSASSVHPPGMNQRGKYHFGSPIAKIQDEHMFGDSLFVSAKYGFSDSGFGLWPADDMDLNQVRTYDIANELASSQSWFFSERPNKQGSIIATYFNDDFLGASHEIKVGGEYIDRWDAWTSGYAGNVRYNFNYNTKTVDWDGNGTRDIVLDEFGVDLRYIYVYRGTYAGGPEGSKQFSGFLMDTATWGRLTLKLGLRYDHQQSYTEGNERRTMFSEDIDHADLGNYYEVQQSFFPNGGAAKIGQMFPGIVIPPVAMSDTVPWKSLSPRFGLTYDITGDGKTIAKLSAAMYGARMASWPAYLWMQGGDSGWLRFYWHDVNSNDAADLNELYWADYSTTARTAYRAFDDAGNFVGNWDREKNLMWGSYDYKDPGALTDPEYQVDPNWHGENTYEVIASVERELMTDVMVGVDFSWRKYNEWWTNRRYYDTVGGRLLERGDYVEAPHNVPSSYTTPDGKTIDLGEAAGKPWYVWGAGVKNLSDRYVTNTPSDYNDIYWGLNLRFQKRLSNRWMLNSSFTYQSQTTHWGAGYPLNPTDQWATDGQPFAYSIGGASGKVSMPVFSRWMLKAQGLYQLPYDFNVSFTFNAREGHIIVSEIDLVDDTAPNSQSTEVTMYTTKYGSDRMPTFWNMNLRLEKILRIGDTGRIYLMIDAFNVFNKNILNRQRGINPGEIYLHDGDFSTYARSGEPNEVLNPRLFRFGVRFQF